MSLNIYYLNINKRIGSLRSKMRYAYVGATEKSMEERYDQHISDNVPIEMNELDRHSWNVEKVTTYKVKNDDTEKHHNNIKKIEDHMIKMIGTIPLLNVMNGRSCRGKLIQTGGNGIVPNEGDLITFYIIWR